MTLADQVAALRRLDPDHRRERRRQGSRGPLRAPEVAPRGRSRSSRVNCAAIPENLLESELFGHEKGAFTGAVARRIGKFEEANGGTLLLDEISEMDARLQAKLLRALQEREIDRVGGTKPVKVDIRILATSNRDLAQAVRDGTFREDLLYRLNVVNLRLPPLRERPGDMRRPGRVLRQEVRRGQRRGRAAALGGGASAGSPTHRWPGNVRELENAMHRAVLLATGPEIDEAAIRLPDGQPLSRRRPAGPHRPGRLARRRDRHPRLRRPDGGRDGAAADPRHPRATASATAPMRPTSSASRSARCATSSRNTPTPASPSRRPREPRVRPDPPPVMGRRGHAGSSPALRGESPWLTSPPSSPSARRARGGGLGGAWRGGAGAGPDRHHHPADPADPGLHAGRAAGSMSITSAVLILMTSLLIKRPLEFTAFPSVLLVTTLYRLGLNIASTRLILGHGHEGVHGAGHIIEAFGKLMMGGSFVIGVIVFAILVVVNFVVITKGSGRIAEVAARFTLDAMPGKQMAIDADLSAGLIDEAEAKQRRKELEQESTFFGAMDGASKFVRGDAIAGLVIVGINVIGGILIGVVQHQMPIGQAFSTYTILTIGDGLVTQIPALIISIAAGLLVSKSGVEGSADKALVTQLATNPISLGMVSAAAGVIAFIPGMPIIPFALISMAAGALAWRRSQKGPDAPRWRSRPIDAGRRGADIPDARHRRDQDRAGLRAPGPHQRPRRPPPDRPDQGAAPHAGRRLRLRHAQRAHPRQHAAAHPGLLHPHQGDGGGRRRGAAGFADGHGPARRPGGAAGRARPRAGLRPAGHLDRREPARGGHLPRLHHRRSGDGADHPPDRDPQGEHAGPPLLRRGPEAPEGPAGRAEEAGGRPDPQRRHGDHRAARAAGPVARAGLDPRPAGDPGRRRRGRPAHRLGHQPRGAGARAAWPASSASPTAARTARCRSSP